MNVAKAIEQALAGMLRKYAALGEGVVLRPWQSLLEDEWKPETDRQFPMVDVRCSPPESDPVERTCIAECALLCGTQVAADPDHAAMSELYNGVQGLADQLYAGAGGNATHAAKWTEFCADVAARIAENEPDETATVSFGGLTYGTPVAPYDDDGVSMIGLAVRVHYSRSDF